MNPIREYQKNRKGIQTILAALLMVVIVVVASVMVYAWSTGLLGALMGGGTGNVGKETLTMDAYAFSSNYNVTLTIRNAGTSAVSFQTYYVKDNSGNTWQLLTWSPAGQPVNPGSAISLNVAIGSTCTAAYGASNCQYTGTSSAFTAFQGGNSYTVQLVTARNTPFPFTVIR